VVLGRLAAVTLPSGRVIGGSLALSNELISFVAVVFGEGDLFDEVEDQMLRRGDRVGRSAI
jgi:hypothetical protein